MANYKIADTTLTSIGDALRRKHGENIITYAPDTVDNSFDIYELPLSSYGNSSAITKNIWLQLEKSTNIKFVYNANIENARIRISGFDRLGTIIGYEDLVNGDNEISVYSDDMCVMIQITFNRDDYTNNTAVANYSGTFYFYKNGELLTKEVATLNTYKPGEMAQAIDDITPILGEITITEPGVYEAPVEIDGYNHINVDIPPAPTDEDLAITGNCLYRFAYNGWNWVIDKYRDKIKTKDIMGASNMFYSSSNLKEIPFEINFKEGGCAIKEMFSYASNLEKVPSIDFKHTTTYQNASSLFTYCNNLKEIGTLKNLYPEGLKSLFADCWMLRELPKLENINMSRIYAYYYSDISGMFERCYSLRSIPSDYMKIFYSPKVSSVYYVFTYNGFKECYSLDEINGIVPITDNMTSNIFLNAFNFCQRLKNITFALQEDGTPYTVNWKNQNIDLSKQVGYCVGTISAPLSDWSEANIRNYAKKILDYNSGITIDKCIYNDETYALLKDDEDAFCMVNDASGYADYGYSRYNHDSAVNTINSLPDTSAYLATAGGTNTIKFFGRAGGKTDGGAINTLTAEEIAVATSKGWTVSFA